MQYQFAGTDPQGRLIYEPTNAQQQQQPQPVMVQPPQSYGMPVAQQQHSACKCSGCHSTAPAPKKDSKSFFSQWFVMEDGVISVSLRNMTITFALLISVTLLLILYFSCNDGTGRYQCTF